MVMIIGYYPGGGGNRYHQFLNNKPFDKSGVAYDWTTTIHFRGSYLNKENQLNNTGSKDVLTHCVNYDRIQQQSNRNDIEIIKTSLKDSLSREWSIKGKYKPMFFPESMSDTDFLLELYQAIKDPSWPNIDNFEDYKSLPKSIYNEVELKLNENRAKTSQQGVYNFLTSAYTAIAWHHDMYKKYPMDPGPGQLIDIDTDQTEFGSVMRTELSLYKNNKLFNFAWEVFESLGNSAPIVTLFNESELSVDYQI
jgi:hypothetical protein